MFDSNYIKLRRLEKAVRSACRRRGVAGDPLDSRVLPMGTLDQELLCLDVLLDLPADLRKTASAKPMVRAAVLSKESPAGPSSRAVDHPQSLHPAIARARRQGR